jgi:hypothetical protein
MSLVRAFKLVTGEEVIAEVQDTFTQKLLQEIVRDVRDNVVYTLRRPHVLQVQQFAPGKFGMAMVPYTLSNPDLETVTIPASHVITSFPAADNVEKQYLQQTSGLALPSADVNGSRFAS